MSSSRPFCSFSLGELETALRELGEPSYRALQLTQWVYQKGTSAYGSMTSIGQKLQEKLAHSFPLGVLSLAKQSTSKDRETTKFLWTLSDGQQVESVLIRSGKRRTVCLSSQVGCPARCAFCASGQFGLVRNVTLAEIMEQFVAIQGMLHKEQEAVTHLVFMGMGEPLENFDVVVRALALLTDPHLGGFSPRKITLSTVGIIDKIEQLLKEGVRVNLALSLHAPSQKIREKIIPYARKAPLEKLLKSVRHYAKSTKRNMTYEYVLLCGINDSIEDARALSKLLKGEPCCVNLIPYNPVLSRKLKRPSPSTIKAFQKTLSRYNVRSTCRFTKGDDIDAACGQLALQPSFPTFCRSAIKNPFEIGGKSV